MNGDVAITNTTPSSTDRGLVVRPIGGGSGGATIVIIGPGGAGNAALSNVAQNIASVQLLAANTGRYGAQIQNDSAGNLYVKFGTTASLTSYTVKMVPNAYYEVPACYTGRIDGIWDAAGAGAARMTEETA